MTVAEAVTLIAAVTASAVSLMTAYVSLRNGDKLAVVHALVDGQGTIMRTLAETAGHERGVAETLDRPALRVQVADTLPGLKPPAAA